MNKNTNIQYPAIIQSHIDAVSKTREALTKMIREAVEKNGCIGTYYKTRGRRYNQFDIESENEYDHSLIVGINDQLSTAPSDYEAVTLMELYIDQEDGGLSCHLKPDDEKDFNHSIEVVIIESLLKIVSWLAENGFVEIESENPWRCEECGSTDVHLKAWVDPNNNNAYVGDCEDFEHSYCNECERDVKIITHDALMTEVND